MPNRSSFRYFKTSPEIIRLAVMLYIPFPLSLRNVEDLLHERGIDVSHETVRCWWGRFGPMFASETPVTYPRCRPSWRTRQTGNRKDVFILSITTLVLKPFMSALL